MLIRLRKASDVASSEITPKEVYLNRRQLIAGTGLIAGSFALGLHRAQAALTPGPGTNPKLENIQEGYRKLGEKDHLTSYDAITSYNNFYEFGTDKDDPAREAHRLKTRPWSVKVDGLCGKPGTIDVDDL